jgi:TonB family protein
MAYVELGQDNGGILLNLSEGGFAVQSALALTSREFSELRFQVPALQGWLTASGRIVWVSDSKKEAGIQFTELPGEARREIEKWVSAGDTPDRTRERIPVAQPSAPVTTPSEQPRKQVFDTPYRGGAHEPAIAHIAQHATQQEREPVRTVETQTVGVRVAVPPLQEFHFTDYSMFAAEPEREGAWSQPARRRGGWRRAALGVVVVGLFFALGATVGRGTVDRWIAYVEGWARSQITTAPPPKVMPPAPPEQPEAGAIETAESNNEAKAAAGENATRTGSGGNPGTGPDANSDAAKSPNEDKSEVEPRTGKTEAARGGSAARSAMAPGVSERRPQHSTENAEPRNGREMEGEPSRMAMGHSILVNAPEPGSRAFFVNLPGEAVSASAGIAISARRTLEILPRSSVAASGSERVIIGKLLSHSEPFYPAEARKGRIEGSVELRARVGRTGGVIAVTPVSGPGLLSSAAMTAVREWRYEPTFINGDPVETLADVTIVFRLP